MAMLERDGHVACSSRCVRLRHEGDVVAFRRLHEALGHPIALGAGHQCGQCLQADGHCEPARVVGHVARRCRSATRFRMAYAVRRQTDFPLQRASRLARCRGYGLPSWLPNSSPHDHINPVRTLRTAARRCRRGIRGRPSTIGDCCARRPPCRLKN